MRRTTVGIYDEDNWHLLEAGISDAPPGLPCLKNIYAAARASTIYYSPGFPHIRRRTAILFRKLWPIRPTAFVQRRINCWVLPRWPSDNRARC